MKIVVTSPLPADLESLLEGFDLTVLRPGPRSPVDLIDALEGAAGAITLLSDPISREVLERTNLRVLANYAVGYDNIDVEAATERGVVVCHTPDVLTDATADLAMALLLSVTRRLPEGHRTVVEGRFTGWGPDFLLGSSLSGKVVGVVGMGRIGRAFARRAEAFDMEILYVARSEKKVPWARVTLDELVERSDVISLHCPLNDETRHMFDRERLASTKRGSYLINTARGPVVDERALVELLESGHLAGAGLDVFEHEPELAPGLAALDNVALAPHLGSATVETRREMAEMVCRDVKRVLRGDPPLHRVPDQQN